MSAPGRLITLEGIDRSGKSLQAGRLADWLQETGKSCLLTREPGGSRIGSRLRELLLDGNLPRQALTSALLFAADRHEHVSSVIRPALEAGKWVVCDRFSDSTTAYQGGEGVDAGTLARINDLACDGLAPDLTVLLRISPQAGSARSGERDYFERGLEYLQQVADNFERLARENPDRFATIDAEQNPDRVFELVQQAVAERLAESGA